MPMVIPTFNPERRDWPFAGKAPQALFDDDGALWEPWSNGSDIGFRITNADGGIAHVFLAPSTGSGDGQPTAFLYQAGGEPYADDPITYVTPHEGFRPNVCSTCGTGHGRCCPLRTGFAGMTVEDARQAAWWRLMQLQLTHWRRADLDRYRLVQVGDQHIVSGVPGSEAAPRRIHAPAGSVVLARLGSDAVQLAVVLSMLTGTLIATPHSALRITTPQPLTTTGAPTC